MKGMMVLFLLVLSNGGGVRAQTSSTRPRMTLTTTAFADGELIPNKYTTAGNGSPVSPPLSWDYVPDGTVSFVLMLTDPDTAVKKTPREVLHWLVFNIPGGARSLPEALTPQAKLSDGSAQLPNESGTVGYLGMGAAAVGPYHHYTFQLFALDNNLDSKQIATAEDVLQAISGHILMKAVLVGRFHR